MDNEHRNPNWLINEKSPYLLQHANNPVNWCALLINLNIPELPVAASPRHILTALSRCNLYARMLAATLVTSPLIQAPSQERIAFLDEQVVCFFITFLHQHILFVLFHRRN